MFIYFFGSCGFAWSACSVSLFIALAPHGRVYRSTADLDVGNATAIFISRYSSDRHRLPLNQILKGCFGHLPLKATPFRGIYIGQPYRMFPRVGDEGISVDHLNDSFFSWHKSSLDVIFAGSNILLIKLPAECQEYRRFYLRYPKYCDIDESNETEEPCGDPKRPSKSE